MLPYGRTGLQSGRRHQSCKHSSGRLQTGGYAPCDVDHTSVGEELVLPPPPPPHFRDHQNRSAKRKLIHTDARAQGRQSAASSTQTERGKAQP